MSDQDGKLEQAAPGKEAEPAAPPPPTIRLTAEIAPPFLIIDLGVHVLTGIQSQFEFIKRRDLAVAIQAQITALCRMRDSLLRGTGSLLIAQPGDVPKR